MQFITNGPDIPDLLLQSHEDGNVVFFCGAGISYPAGLPGFKGLVDGIFEKVGTSYTDIEQRTYDKQQYDTTLDLLERRVPGKKSAVRQALFEVLKPNTRKKGALDTHKSLLKLSKNKHGVTRLITTNFDRLFESASKSLKVKSKVFTAPLVPIAKRSKWDGIVYLHGMLPKVLDDIELQKLVITSGDFGLAYLTERWASRFVSTLLKEYTVCFIGYSIDDPVMRYMMDALAADRELGEDAPTAYAFGSCAPGEDKEAYLQWEAKGVEPILYQVPKGSNDHSQLHDTLKNWAEIYQKGITGKENVVNTHALAHPSRSTAQDNFIGRMLWALTDKSGLPAKQFAELEPAPPLGWLDVFTEFNFKYHDLSRFGIQPNTLVDEKLEFSLIKRPAPYELSAWMSLSSSNVRSEWDGVMSQIARWLARYIYDPKFFIWLVNHVGAPHHQLIRILEGALDSERNGSKNRISLSSTGLSNESSKECMRQLWQLYLNGQIKSNFYHSNIYNWMRQFDRDGLTVSLRLKLRELLAPRMKVSEPFREWKSKSQEPSKISQIIHYELMLNTDHVQSAVKSLNGKKWEQALPGLIEDFACLLTDALDILSVIEGHDSYGDRSYWDLPSIEPHWQNRNFKEWVFLIEFLRDSWLKVFEEQPEKACKIASSWFDKPYPTFKRLAFFAACQDDCIDSGIWVSWLLSENARCLWEVQTKREVMRLLVLQGNTIECSEGEKLEENILIGPPRTMYKKDLSQESFRDIADHAIWLRLAKLESSGRKLGEHAKSKLTELTDNYPFKLDSHQKDEFSHWMSGTGDPGFERENNIEIVPRKRKELVNWLKDTQEESKFWERCRTHPLNVLFALTDLAEEDIWPTNYIGDALNAWSTKKPRQGKRLWEMCSILIQMMPPKVFAVLVRPIASYISRVAKSLDHYDKSLFSICNLILEFGREESPLDTEDMLIEAINHPIGLACTAVLEVWFNHELNDGDGLPESVRAFFTKVCDRSKEHYVYGRTVLTGSLLTLFRVDRKWTEENLLPLFNWDESSLEAKSAWQGFMWAPRIYPPLLNALKDDLLNTTSHFEQLNSHKNQFAAFLTHVALSKPSAYTIPELQYAFSQLSTEALVQVSRTLEQVIKSKTDESEDFWINRIEPFWQKIWPKSLEHISAKISENLAEVAIASSVDFPDVLNSIKGWLVPIEYPDMFLRSLSKTDIPHTFPYETLNFLDPLVGENSYVDEHLKKCLDKVIIAEPKLADNPIYIRLFEQYRRMKG